MVFIATLKKDESLDAFSSVESQDGVRLFGRKNGEIDQPWVNDGRGQKKLRIFSPDQIMKVSWLHHSRCLLLVCQCDDRAALKIPTRSAV